MVPSNIHTIYGKRFPIPKSLDECRGVDWYLPEVNLEESTRLSEFAEHKISPVLNIDTLLKVADFRGKLSRVVSFPQIVLSVDEDSDAIRALSPRLSDDKKRAETLTLIERMIAFCSERSNCLVGLTVEELCPGGLDPADGVDLAQRFVNAGAKGIIASSGTLDFPALKWRRATKLKVDREETKDLWPETWLSGALWLRGRVDAPIYAQGIVADADHTLPLAAKLGLAGIIDISVKYPSSP